MAAKGRFSIEGWVEPGVTIHFEVTFDDASGFGDYDDGERDELPEEQPDELTAEYPHEAYTPLSNVVGLSSK